MKNKKSILMMLTVILTVFCFVSVAEAATAKLSAKKAVLVVGQTKTLKVTGTKAKVTWKTSKRSVATVTAKGKVKAIKAGTATITAKVGKKKLTCKVTVENPKISAKTASVTEGAKVTLKLNNLKTKQAVTWKSSNTKVASVGKKTGVVTGKTAGTATITATVLKKNYTCKLTVKAAPKTPEIQWETREYKDNGETLITIQVPKGWRFDVSYVSYGNTAPKISVFPSWNNMNLMMEYRFSRAMLKSERSQNWYKARNYAFKSLAYVIPVKGYKSNGMDTAGAFMGFRTDESVTTKNSALKIMNPTVIKKLGSSDFSGDTLYCGMTIGGIKYNELFAAKVLNGYNYAVYDDNGALDAGTVAVYNTVTLRAPSATFSEWLPVLAKIYGSIRYTDAMYERFAKEQEITLAAAKESYQINSARSTQMVNDFSAYIRK